MARVPIIRLGDLVLATLLEDLNDRDALRLQEDIMAALERGGSRGLLLDISVIEIIDSFLGRLLNDIAVGARLLGAQAVVVGMQPAVAITLVELGLDLRAIRTAINVEQGIARLRQSLAAEKYGAQRRA